MSRKGLRSVAAAAAAAAALCLATPAAAQRCGATVLSQDFNQYSGGFKPYTKALAHRDFGKLVRKGGRKTGLIFLNGSERGQVGDGMLRSEQPQGCVGTRACGIQFDVGLPQSLESATFSFRFRFSDDYDWTKGGKLPGMCDNICPSGCGPHDDSFSSRIMWRDDGALMSYMYHPEKVDNCGDNWYWGGSTATAGRWMFQKTFIKMNDPGKANGVQQVWLDGKLVYSADDIVYRFDKTVALDRFTFRNFHGGSDARFAPGKTQHIWFDDIKVQAGRCPGGAGGSPPAVLRAPLGEAGSRVGAEDMFVESSPGSSPPGPRRSPRPPSPPPPRKAATRPPPPPPARAPAKKTPPPPSPARKPARRTPPSRPQPKGKYGRISNKGKRPPSPAPASKPARRSSTPPPPQGKYGRVKRARRHSGRTRAPRRRRRSSSRRRRSRRLQQFAPTARVAARGTARRAAAAAVPALPAPAHPVAAQRGPLCSVFGAACQAWGHAWRPELLQRGGDRPAARRAPTSLHS